MFSIPFELDRTIVINKPVASVFDVLGDFNDWDKWSPWIIQEPTCPIKVEGNKGELGHKQSWNGERIGSGTIEIINKEADKSIEFDLHFISPWKSHSKTQFQFETITDGEGNDATKVTWAMQGTLPFFMFFMKKMMSVYVGGDYERGLKMAKEFIETGVVTSKVDITGVVHKDGFYYAGCACTFAANKVSEAVGPAFEKLHAMDIPQPDFVATIVNEFDLVKNQGDMIAAFGYKQRPDFTLPLGMVEGEQPPHKACEVIHTGSYYHIPNGWVTLINYMRFAKLKNNKKAKDYEVYLNSPIETAPKDLKTMMVTPIK